MSDFEIIDFHTHPFLNQASNICSHTEFCSMSAENTERDLKKLGISKICGSVIIPVKRGEAVTEKHLAETNAQAFELKKMYGDYYIPGFHVHPDFPQFSFDTVKTMHEAGFNLIGELVPYHHGWDDYSSEGFSEILCAAEKYDMIVSFHSMNNDSMDKMVKAHPNVRFVAAHPGEYGDFMRHMERMKMSDNYYLDLSGTGIFRYGMLRRAIDLFGPDRFIFGSDYPTCNPAMFIGGVRDDLLLTDAEKEKILSLNAKRLLGIG